ncbi:MAG: hypothetical protein HRF46_10770 [Acidobacteriota bacterium]
MNRRMWFSLAFLSVVATASAQETGRRPIQGTDPVKPKAEPKTIYLDAYVTADKDGPTVHCENKGIKCVHQARLLAPPRATPAHNATLQELTAAINRTLDSLTPPPGMKLCLYRSVRGPILLWARDATASPRDLPGRSLRTPERAAAPITDDEKIADMLGIQEPAGRYLGGNLLAKVVWNELGQSFFACPTKGNDCVVKPKLATSSQARVHDARLSRATEEINQLLEGAAARAPQGGQRLCLVFLPDGPVLLWTHESEPLGRAVSSEDPDFARAARQALGLDQ